MIILNEINKKIVFSLSLLLGLFLPHSATYGQAIHGLLPLFLFILLVDIKKFKINKITLVLFFVIFISFTLNFLSGEISDLKSFTRLLSLSILFLLFPFTSYIRVPNVVLYGALLFIFTSQISYVLGIDPLVRFFNTFYPYEGDTRGLTSEFLLSGSGEIDFITKRRYGGLYHNPNQAIRFVTAIFLIYLIENKKNHFLRKLPFVAIVFISVALTGSRTGLLVTAIFLLCNFVYLETKIKKYLLVALIGILLLANTLYQQNTSIDLRSFKVSEGFVDSLGQKVEWFSAYYDQTDSPLNILFGHFSATNIQEKFGIPLLDSEWGESIYNFGLVYVIVLLVFYVYLYKTRDINIRFTLLLLLWCISSTVLLSFRMSFLFMFILSNYYSRYLLNETE